MSGWLSKQRQKLFAIKDTAHSIAWGAAIGIFVGFTPLFGLRLVLALSLAFLFRVNKVAALVGASLHELALPFWPALYLLEYNIGYWLLHDPHQLPPHPDVEQLHPRIWLNWATLAKVGGPMLLGSVIVGAPTAWLAFFLTKRAVLRTQKRRHTPPAPHSPRS